MIRVDRSLNKNVFLQILNSGHIIDTSIKTIAKIKRTKDIKRLLLMIKYTHI